MSLDDIKKYIISNLYRVDGKLNSAFVKRDIFKNSPEMSSILNYTQFLHPTCSLPERLFCILNDICEVQICPICNTMEKAFLPSAGIGYSKTCNNPVCRSTASSNKAKRTKIEKYGKCASPKQQQLSKERMQLFNKSNRCKQIIKERYNVDNVSQIDAIKQKKKQTMLENYGVEHSSQIPSLKEDRAKLKNVLYTKRSNGKATDVTVEKRTTDKRHLFNVTFTCTACNNTEVLFGETFLWRCKHVSHPCTKCSGIIVGSVKQYELANYIMSITDAEVILNDKNVLANIQRELDVYIPSLKLAFEFDGVFWHSYNSIETPEQRNLHLLKTKTCEEQGIQLIHIFETEWDNKQDIVKSCISSLLHKNARVFARKCIVKQITKHEATAFVDANHLQGSNGSSTHHYGLYNNNELISVMTFGASRFDKTVQWEMVRFCSKLDTQVVGGASKLFTAFIKDMNPDSVISYSDRRWSTVTNCVYDRLEFKNIRTSSPSYFYFKSQEGMKLFNRISFQKHKLKDKLAIFDPNKTEAENMFDNGYRRIWDCGNGVWKWTKK